MMHYRLKQISIVRLDAEYVGFHLKIISHEATEEEQAALIEFEMATNTSGEEEGSAESLDLSDLIPPSWDRKTSGVVSWRLPIASARAFAQQILEMAE